MGGEETKDALPRGRGRKGLSQKKLSYVALVFFRGNKETRWTHFQKFLRSCDIDLTLSSLASSTFSKA